MNPTLEQVRADPLLTEVAIAYKNSVYIWNQAAPTITVSAESGKYYVYDRGDWFRPNAKLVAPGDVPPLAGWAISKDAYTCEEFAVATTIPDRVVAEAAAVTDLRRDATLWVTEQLNLTLERQLAEEIFTTSVWGTDNPTATDWDDYANSTPLWDVQAAADAVQSATGYRANTLILGARVMAALRFHPDVTELVKYTQKGVVTPELLAQIWDFDRVLVGSAVYNAGEPGTVDMKPVWGNHALVCYVPQTPGLLTPSAMYTFVARPLQVRRYYNQERMAEVVRADVILDFKVTGAALGYFFPEIV
ncbi:MAG: major capsid protein [Candidatus Bipolaricaulota bacterium]|nr:major capsid protein [Candidatus Bipolaricaulota bacterium]